MTIEKAKELKDARIGFVSLVDKAANKRRFLVAKAENGKAQFTTYGRIIKVDADTHYITGIVYEPLVEDSQGEFMTEEEIRKAAYWFAKNGDKVDLQHSFVAAEGVSIVENYIAPCDMEIGGEPVAKGTWLLTVEVTDPGIWEAVQKKEITGFSMGGYATISEEDTDLSAISKSVLEQPPGKPAMPLITGEIGQELVAEVQKEEKPWLVRKFLELVGYDVVEKGAVMEIYQYSAKFDNFWNAFHALQDVLRRYNWSTDRYEFESDETTIREALAEFTAIVSDILTEKNVVKMLAEAIPEPQPTQKKEETKMTKEEIQAMITEGLTGLEKSIDERIEKAMENNGPEVGAQQEPTAPDGDGQPPTETVTKEDIQGMIDEAVTKAVEPILKARGLPSNLNDEPGDPTQKSESVFSGFFTEE